jgi:hypothetical protein
MRELCGIELPQYQGVEELGTCGLLKTAQTESLRWESLPSPEALCGVAMAANSRISHVGLWLDIDGGGILHSNRASGVVFQSLATIRQNGIQNFKFYKFKP